MTEIRKICFDAEPAGEPAGQRHHNRRAYDIGGQRPGDLVQRGRQAPLDVWQGDIEDRVVDALHDVRQHDRDRDSSTKACARTNPPRTSAVRYRILGRHDESSRAIPARRNASCSSAAGIRNHRASQIWQAAAGRLYLAVRRHWLYQVIRAGRQLAAAANDILNSFMAPVAAPLRSRTANPLRRSRRSRRRQRVAAPREWSYISTVKIPSTERREPREAQENHSGSSAVWSR
jgi:hypothetical protein